MAPSKQAPLPPFAKDEKVLCFHGDLMYEAKITDLRSASDHANTNPQTIKPDDAQYRVHYKGWKASWDDWVAQDRIRKFTDDNKTLAAQLQAAARLRNAGGSKSAKKAIGKAAGPGESEMSSARGSEERAATNSFAGRGPRRGRDYELESEEAFYARPSIKIIIPDMLKGLLVDDWENVTKNNQLVPIPHPKPVSKVMGDYLAYEKPRRTEGSAAIDILEETVAGLKEYFDKSLGRILLYRFERAQYAEIREKWTSGGPDTPCDTYGAEHLMRLITSLPELIAQTNMDQQSVNRLREELSKFCQWLERNAGAYFVSEYESPNAEYAEKAKN
ncbi:MRG-domain-containing protein [Apiospora saccharicola]|uniref:Chromatin modification-related protein EAF3 n=1 Tax=Apiospora saccharicola TaxID=335842 RepID=A0ABR1W334_9PEZI